MNLTKTSDNWFFYDHKFKKKEKQVLRISLIYRILSIKKKDPRIMRLYEEFFIKKWKKMLN